MFYSSHLWSISLQSHHNGCNGISNHQPHHCLLNHLFRHRSKKTSKLRVTGLCAGNSLLTGEFPAQRASNLENFSIWWCHHDWVKNGCIVKAFDYNMWLLYGRDCGTNSLIEMGVGFAAGFLCWEKTIISTLFQMTWHSHEILLQGYHPVLKGVCRCYPAKRALPAMLTHGR